MRKLPHYDYLLDGAPEDGRPKPLLLFLHGKGERGGELGAVRAHGPPNLFPRYGLDRFQLLSPHCPAEQKWDALKVDEFLSAFCETHPVEPRRVYLTGLSLGAEGGFHLLVRDRERFAAAVLVCGRVDPDATKGLTGPWPPTWLVHSARDDVVPVAHSDAVHAALKHIGAKVKYSRYWFVRHVQTWQKAYGATTLFDWLLEHTRE